MTPEGLEPEIRRMLSLLPGDWSVKIVPSDASGRWLVGAVSADGNVILTSGMGRTKDEALLKLLENWRKGRAEPYAPAAGSAEELELKLAVRKG